MENNEDEQNTGLSNFTLGMLLALFALLWFLTAIVWVYFSSTSV